MVRPSDHQHERGHEITVADILAPTTVEQFLARSWNRSLLHVAGTAGRFHDLAGWNGLNILLEECPLDSRHLRVMRNGKKIADDLYLTRTKSLDAGALAAILDQGATIVIDFIDGLLPSVGRIADDFADALSARVWVNLYASWGNESGLKLHCDCHDVIILQIAGDKSWTVFAPTRRNPNEGDAFEAPSVDAKPNWSGVLRDGEALYIPRGWPHIAVPTGEPSLHLTISLGQPTGSEYLRWLADELDKNPDVRAAIPASGANGKIGDWLVEMRQLVEQTMTLPSIDAFLGREAAEQQARPRFSLPHFARTPPDQWLSSTAFRLASTRKLDIRHSANGTISVGAAKRQISCPASLEPALTRLSSRQPVSLETMENAIDPQASRDLRRSLAIMVQLGILFSEQAG